MEALLDTSCSEEKKATALDDLLEFVEDIDLARDFLVIGGLRPLLDGLHPLVVFISPPSSLLFFPRASISRC
jgi:hypothetical protein